MTTVNYQPALQAEYAARARTWSDIQGHLPTLYEAVACRTAPTVVELGVRWGTSTSALLAATDAAHGHLWSVDITDPTVPAWWHDTGRWTLIVGDDLDQATRDALPDKIDVLFIDTSHAYDHMLAELSAYVPCVKPGGVVLCHDTELEAPDLVGAQPPFPVARALDDYCDKTGLTWVNHTGSYGLGVITIPDGADE